MSEGMTLELTLMRFGSSAFCPMMRYVWFCFKYFFKIFYKYFLQVPMIEEVKCSTRPSLDMVPRPYSPSRTASHRPLPLPGPFHRRCCPFFIFSIIKKDSKFANRWINVDFFSHFFWQKKKQSKSRCLLSFLLKESKRENVETVQAHNNKKLSDTLKCVFKISVWVKSLIGWRKKSKRESERHIQ